MKSFNIAYLFLTTGIGIGVGFGLTQVLTNTPAVASINSPSFDSRQSLAPLVEDLSPVVVNIDVEAEMNTMQDGFFNGFGPDHRTQRGQGSGFIISSDGYILTNHHVIEGADSVKVRMQSGVIYDGTIVGKDDSTDVALIKITPNDVLPFASLGDSDALKVGDWVVAIGNPFGLGHTVTSGIVSAKERIIGAGPYDDFIQTDASINPGNSGGPLFNLKGEVVAINTAINPRAQGIGFSVPINLIKDNLSELKTNGFVSRGWLGVALATSTQTIETTKADVESVVIQSVYAETPAENGGLKQGDIITHLDGEEVKDRDSLIRDIGMYRSGDTIAVALIRKGKKKTLKVKLGKRPTEAELSSGSFSNGSQQTPHTLGIQVEEQMGFDPNNPHLKGLQIMSIKKGSVSYGHLKEGDILVEANGYSLNSPYALLRELQALSSKLNLKIYRVDQYQDIDILFPED